MFGTNTFAQSAFAATGGLYLVLQDEALVPTDTQVSQLDAVAAQLETQAATDVYAPILQYNITKAETTAVADAVANYLQALASQSDTTAATDAIQAQLDAIASRSDTTLAADNFANTLTALAAQQETQTPADAYSPILQYNVTRVDTSATGDAFINFLAAAAAQAENTAATDFQTFTVDTVALLVGIPIVIGVGYPLVWGLIDVEQDAQWAEITPVFLVSDIAVFGGMMFGGVPYAGSITETFIVDTAVWTQIDDEDSTLWTEVVT